MPALTTGATANGDRVRHDNVTIKRVCDATASLTARRVKPMTGPPATVGILLQWGIGDAVLNQPFLAAVRAAWPAAEIDFLGKPWLAELFSGDRLANRFLALVPPWTRSRGKYNVWERDWRVFARQLSAIRKRRYDLLIGLRWDAREIFQLRLLRAQATAGFAGAGGRDWVTIDLGLATNDFAAIHRSAAAAHAAHALTGNSVSTAPHLAVRESQRRQALDALRRAGWSGGAALAVHAGAGNPGRAWPAEKFSAVLHDVRTRIGCVAFIDDGSSSPKPVAPPGIPFLRWSGTLAEMKAMLSVCDVLLCNDSGPMHVAAAVGCRVVAVFGPTSSLWFGPVGAGNRVVCVDPMPCRPCLDSCIYASPRCMEGVETGMASAAVSDLLSAFAPERSPLARHGHDH